MICIYGLTVRPFTVLFPKEYHTPCRVFRD